MKKIQFIIVLSLFFNQFLFAGTNSKVYDIAGKDTSSLIVKDLSKNKTIYKKGETKLLRPASLTKIMTCILAIESGKLDQKVTITPAMIKVEPTIIGLKAGDQVSLRNLVHAAMIKSANDAAFSIAYFLGNGKKDNFINQMNKKAKKLGMKNTHFENPAGFDHPNHKTTAKDLTKLAEYAIKNRTFNSIVNKKSYSFNALNSNKKFSLYTSNKLQKENKYVVGLKTGYTSGAGACLIARAKKDKKDILLVMLDASNRWINAKNIVNEAFNTNKANKSRIASKSETKSKKVKIASKKATKSKAKHKIASNKNLSKTSKNKKDQIALANDSQNSRVHSIDKIESLYTNL